MPCSNSSRRDARKSAASAKPDLMTARSAATASLPDATRRTRVTPHTARMLRPSATMANAASRRSMPGARASAASSRACRSRATVCATTPDIVSPARSSMSPGGQRQNGSTGDGDLRTAVKGLRLNRPHQPLLEEIVESAPRAERTLDRRSSQGARAEDDDRPVEERKVNGCGDGSAAIADATAPGGCACACAARAAQIVSARQAATSVRIGLTRDSA